MDLNSVTINDFRSVAALSNTGSFRAAADALGVSPSALSRQITGLESRLGARLFDRDTRNVTPTASGRVFASIAQRMLNTIEDGMVEFEAHVSARRGRLTIAGLPSVTQGLLPGILQTFAAEHPDVDLRIIDALSGSVIEAVESGVADIGFTAGTPSARSRLDFHPIMKDEFVAIGHPDGPLADERGYPWSEIASMPFIAMAEGTSVRELTDAACLRIDSVMSPRFEVAHLATAGALVASGLGVTALPTLTLPMMNTTELVRREISDFGAKRRIGLVRRNGRTLSPTAAAFVQVVRNSSGKVTDN